MQGFSLINQRLVIELLFLCVNLRSQEFAIRHAIQRLKWTVAVFDQRMILDTS